MKTFYGECILKKQYDMGSDPKEERKALGCWIRANDPKLTQKEAEALVHLFDFSALYKK